MTFRGSRSYGVRNPTSYTLSKSIVQTMKVTRTSQLSGKTRTLDIDITPEQLQQVEIGDELIQNIVPHLNSSDREFLITGITEEEWNTAFPEEDDDVSSDDDVEVLQIGIPLQQSLVGRLKEYLKEPPEEGYKGRKLIVLSDPSLINTSKMHSLYEKLNRLHKEYEVAFLVDRTRTVSAADFEGLDVEIIDKLSTVTVVDRIDVVKPSRVDMDEIILKTSPAMVNPYIENKSKNKKLKHRDYPKFKKK